MTADDLIRLTGEALFGDRFVADLSRALRVNDREIRRWLSGEHDPPPGVWAELATICQVRRDTLAELAKPLSEAAKAGN